MISLEHNSEDFHSELFPLHSPLLRESLLVSFPPPSYMLKFSGYSCLIGGPIGFAAIALILQFYFKEDTLSEGTV